MDQYLEIVDRHGIKTIFVCFDDCWNPRYQTGRQPDPRPGVHNSGWIRDPGDLLYDEPDLMKRLEVYLKDILKTFRDDDRIVLRDLYNEPGNSGYGSRSMPLLRNVFEWGRKISPAQPLAAGAIIWGRVAGKSNTKYAWDEPDPDGSDPPLWFHEIFRPDGTPYRRDEVDLIRSLTTGKQGRPGRSAVIFIHYCFGLRSKLFNSRGSWGFPGGINRRIE